MNPIILYLVLFLLAAAGVASGRCLVRLEKDVEQMRDLLARYSRVIAEHEGKLHVQGQNESDFDAALTVLQDWVTSANERFSVLEEQQGDDHGELENCQEHLEILNDRAGDFQHAIAEHELAIQNIQERLEHIPVEQMRANAEREEKFFQGVQNIMDYSPENVARLNVGGVRLE